MDSFGARLKNLRRQNYLTQDELAGQLEEMGCSATSKCAISQYENNKRLPDIKALTIIAKLFAVSVDYLLGSTDVSDGETRILSLYRRLDDKGKNMLTAYATALFDVDMRTGS